MGKPTTVLWTRPALNSLLDIVQYIQVESPSAAARPAKQIKSKIFRLERFPTSGRAVPEFPRSGLREGIVGNYRVIYRFAKEKSRVDVLAVRHGARLLEESPEAKER